MNDSILSQAEIDALLKKNENTTPSADDKLTKVFMPMVSKFPEYLRRLIRPSVDISASYFERVHQDLSVVFRQAVFITPIELKIGIIYLLVTEHDGEILATTLGTSAVQGITLLSQELTKILSDHLGDLLSPHLTMRSRQPILVRTPQLTNYKFTTPNYLLRLNIEWDGTGIELVILLTPEIISNLCNATNDHTQSRIRQQPIHPSKRSLRQTRFPVETFDFENLSKQNSDPTDQKIDLVNDVYINVVVELGACQLTVGEIMELKKGSTISLNRVAGEPADVHVNGRNIAKGEVTVLDENFGVRILEIVPAKQRINE